MQTVNVKNEDQANAIVRAIYERRSVRKFSDRPVAKQQIDQIIDAGRMAPSAMNHQPWSFYVLTDKAEIKTFSKEISRASVKEISRMGIKDILKSAAGLIHAIANVDFFTMEDFVFHGAPVVIFLTAPKDNEWSSLDIGMCAQNMMLAAHSLGLASCPVGFGKFVEHTKDYPRLRIPANEQVLLSVIFGYADEQPVVHERRKNNVFFLNG
ncbi:MAG TPA: nitroreductase [Bacteroidia bacterium]|nr:nitroreductase [Bacteroidia bacterium]